VLVPLIKEELDAGERAGMEHYERAGRMLLEAKDQVSGGEWERWLKNNFHLSRATAWRYIKLVSSPDDARRRAFTRLTECRVPAAPPSAALAAPGPASCVPR
jgi:hypothetical protein